MQASESSVDALIMTDELVGECETWHEATLLEPEDKGTRDEMPSTSTKVMSHFLNPEQ